MELAALKQVCHWPICYFSDQNVTEICDVCGKEALKCSRFRCDRCKLGNFCSIHCKEQFRGIQMPLCNFINAKLYNLDIEWDEKPELYIQNKMTQDQKNKAHDPAYQLQEFDMIKAEGNELFRLKEYSSAMDTYVTCYERLEQFWGKVDKVPEIKQDYFDLQISLLVNMSQCELKVRNFQASIKRCNQALALRPSKAKALFIRGKAFSALGQDDEALESFLKALKLDPSSADVCNKEVKILKDRKQR